MNLDLYSYSLALLIFTAFLFFCDIHTPSTCAGVSAAQRRATYVMLGLCVRTSSKWLPTVQKMVMFLLHSWHSDIQHVRALKLVNVDLGCHDGVVATPLACS